MTTLITCEDTGIGLENGIEGVRRERPPVLLALTALAIVVSAPSVAQQGRDLLAREEPVRERLFAKEAIRDVVVHEVGDISLVEAAASAPARVASAATTEYKYDDGTFERWTFLQDTTGQPLYEQEYAQRFRLNQAGTVVHVGLCVARSQERGNSSRLPFTLAFYRDSAGRPGSRLASAQGNVTINTPGRGGCATLDLSSSAFRLGSGNTWVGLAWRNSGGMLTGEDTNGPGGTRTVYRGRRSSTASWSSWTNDSVTYGIRLGVDHGGGGTPPPDPNPDPDPDPDPPPTSGCTPTTTALQFDGGYTVSMCYRTPDGREGQAKSGIWASSQAGLLWFFDRENAEVLVKVLNGCSHNAHRWVYVAPVTDLEFNLWVTGPDGRRWTHSNRQGTTASTKADTRAFQCSNEDGGGNPPSSAPDLVVASPSVSNSSPGSGGSFTLRATVRNQGNSSSSSTTLRYYRSSNATISTSDTLVGTDAVSALSPSGSSPESISLTAPSSSGTHYYGACVDAVSGESSTGNNCSQGVRVTVMGGGGGGTRYNVGDVITTLPTGSWFPSVTRSGCSIQVSGGTTTVQCGRGGNFEYQSYRYTCEASSCRIEGRTVTAGTWLATSRATTSYSSYSTSDHVTSATTEGCTPTTTALSFDGGYTVSMCYRTPDGREGQAKSGIWASSQAGLLWFFDRENAEVLVKVLNGCSHNAHRWVYVAPVTDLEFNLWVTGPDGRRWTHSNRQGTTASTKADTRAFQCSNEDGGGNPPSSAPDLVVASPSVSNSSPGSGGSFTLRATVRNQGNSSSSSTTLRYYRSSNATISTSDTLVGTDAVSALSPSGSSPESISLTAPSNSGTYYYGACVDAVSGESSTGNNCSQGVRVTVTGGGGIDDAVTAQLTECSGSRRGNFVDVTMRGTLQARRRVTNVTVTGYANENLIGTRSTSSIAAGSSWSFTISGSFQDPTATRVQCRAEWRASVPAGAKGIGLATAESPVLPVSEE